jgi:hypothetical protein
VIEMRRRDDWVEMRFGIIELIRKFGRE